MPRPEEDPNLRFQFWRAIQERQNPVKRPKFDRLGSLELSRKQQLSMLYELMIKRPDYLQGGIRSLEGLNLPVDGNLRPFGVGAFLQVYIDEVAGFNDEYSVDEEPRTKEQEANYWLGLGFKMLGNSDEDTKALVKWMQGHPDQIAQRFTEEWALGKEISDEFLRLAHEGKLKRIDFE